MKLNILFRRAVEIGIEADPRGRKRIEKMLRKQQEKWKKLDVKEQEKELFDEERTWNPFPDSRIIAGTGEEEVRSLFVGIDVETQEVLLADRLREKGMRIDALMIHHPEGRALADLEKIMPLQVDMLAAYGVPVNHSEAHLRPRMDRVWRAIHSDNLFRTERAAELLGFPAFNTHTITDNLVYRFMEEHICKKEYDTLDEIVSAINDIPEYKVFAKKGNPTTIVHGTGGARPGRIAATEFTGGTNGPEELLKEQSLAGIGTILTMHATEKTLDAAKEHHVNMVQCSHMASDTIGMNLLLDKLMKMDKRLTTIDASGFIRVKRR
ncbi:MAG: hypothetical protein Greene041619_308 [Candidatus Peregrinibacteria bacterium Greene0416_19]|nr:MAG: hypothetical protein Greene041619_308 [Candidatus Peregrinibacteria bacterium Greene0416_19]